MDEKINWGEGLTDRQRAVLSVLLLAHQQRRLTSREYELCRDYVLGIGAAAP